MGTKDISLVGLGTIDSKISQSLTNRKEFLENYLAQLENFAVSKGYSLEDISNLTYKEKLDISVGPDILIKKIDLSEEEKEENKRIWSIAFFFSGCSTILKNVQDITSGFSIEGITPYGTIRDIDFKLEKSDIELWTENLFKLWFKAWERELDRHIIVDFENIPISNDFFSEMIYSMEYYKDFVKKTKINMNNNNEESNYENFGLKIFDQEFLNRALEIVLIWTPENMIKRVINAFTWSEETNDTVFANIGKRKMSESTMGFSCSSMRSHCRNIGILTMNSLLDPSQVTKDIEEHAKNEFDDVLVSINGKDRDNIEGRNIKAAFFAMLFSYAGFLPYTIKIIENAEKDVWQDIIRFGKMLVNFKEDGKAVGYYEAVSDFLNLKKYKLKVALIPKWTREYKNLENKIIKFRKNFRVVGRKNIWENLLKDSYIHTGNSSGYDKIFGKHENPIPYDTWIDSQDLKYAIRKIEENKNHFPLEVTKRARHIFEDVIINSSSQAIKKDIMNNVDKIITETEDKDESLIYLEILKKYRIRRLAFSHNVSKEELSLILVAEEIENLKFLLKEMTPEYINTSVTLHARENQNFTASVQVLLEKNVFNEIRDAKKNFKYIWSFKPSKKSITSVLQWEDDSSKFFSSFDINYSIGSGELSCSVQVFANDEDKGIFLSDNVIQVTVLEDCKRCNKIYNPNDNNYGECKFHPPMNVTQSFVSQQSCVSSAQRNWEYFVNIWKEQWGFLDVDSKIDWLNRTFYNLSPYLNIEYIDNKKNLSILEVTFRKICYKIEMVPFSLVLELLFDFPWLKSNEERYTINGKLSIPRKLLNYITELPINYLEIIKRNWLEFQSSSGQIKKGSNLTTKRDEGFYGLWNKKKMSEINTDRIIDPLDEMSCDPARFQLVRLTPSNFWVDDYTTQKYKSLLKPNGYDMKSGKWLCCKNTSPNDPGCWMDSHTSIQSGITFYDSPETNSLLGSVPIVRLHQFQKLHEQKMRYVQRNLRDKVVLLSDKYRELQCLYANYDISDIMERKYIYRSNDKIIKSSFGDGHLKHSSRHENYDDSDDENEYLEDESIMSSSGSDSEDYEIELKPKRKKDKNEEKERLRREREEYEEMIILLGDRERARREMEEYEIEQRKKKENERKDDESEIDEEDKTDEENKIDNEDELDLGLFDNVKKTDVEEKKNIFNTFTIFPRLGLAIKSLKTKS